MSGTNRGKQFETKVREGMEKVGEVSVDRLLDPMAGYSGVRNICDFIVYHYPTIYYVECKSHLGNTLPFSCVTTNQWEGLLNKKKIDNKIVAGLLVWFIDHDVTVFVSIDILEDMRLNGKKSLNIKDLDSIECTIIPSKKKRVLCDYDFNEFFN